MLCSLARHFTLSVPLSKQVYQRVLVKFNAEGNPAADWYPTPGGEVKILLFPLMLQKLLVVWLSWPDAEFTEYKSQYNFTHKCHLKLNLF